VGVTSPVGPSVNTSDDVAGPESAVSVAGVAVSAASEASAVVATSLASETSAALSGAGVDDDELHAQRIVSAMEQERFFMRVA
jgi:hypothetical protein